MKTKILVIDDEEIMRLTLEEGFLDLGYHVETAQNGIDGIEKLKSFRPDVILLDMKLKGEDGLQVAEKIKEIDEYVAIIIMTAYGDIKTAIKAIKLGAIDYIKKPLDIEEIEVTISKAIASQHMKKKLMLYEEKELREGNVFISKDPIMEETIKKMNILAENDSVTVLIRGETGTGKEVVANYIHKNCSRKDSVMLSINCAAIPGQLLESELFGFEKNAFSGANARKKGLLELAHGGTLFLDELGEIPLDIQAKLLRFLETRKFKRIGGLEEIEVDIRIIAATNNNLEEAVDKKEFREDFYYRLNVVPICIPSLKERKLDIEELSEYFLHVYCTKFKKKFRGFTKEAIEKMIDYDWPGNVRELKNIMERIVILNDGDLIEVEYLPNEMQKRGCKPKNIEALSQKEGGIEEGFSLEKAVRELEKLWILKALNQSKGNFSHAAKLLGISRHALNRRMEKYMKDY
ncbi:two-component system, NtrC family, response regulator AtoC [Anaerovirgula multivorans]|uniref:Stage 0 sporulation protein A homolog n=1 Tax=Anaerovirgula multivorans TaxID=312168 RepID=A0A239HKD4_9FIRM|nr:sigma-54 dependent transcriptional regulator [Anaerovirgula multivorans]SNS81859.1 two-component system, NtrC family, response regulator AtoC [Anaerovirgula multivorans]